MTPSVPAAGRDARATDSLRCFPSWWVFPQWGGPPCPPRAETPAPRTACSVSPVGGCSPSGAGLGARRFLARQFFSLRNAQPRPETAPKIEPTGAGKSTQLARANTAVMQGRTNQNTP